MKQLILDAAMKLFLDKGFYSVSIRNIADAIEYSPATIYLYFKDKDDILFALHNAGFERLYKRQQKTLTIKDPGDRLRKQGEVYIRFALEQPEYYNLMFIMRSPLRKVGKDEKWNAGRRAYETLKDNVEAAINAGVLEKADPEIATYALWSLAHGIVSLILRNRCPIADKKAQLNIALDTFGFLASNLGFAA